MYALPATHTPIISYVTVVQRVRVCVLTVTAMYRSVSSLPGGERTIQGTPGFN